MADVVVSDHGSIVTLTPLTPEAHGWIDEWIADPTWVGNQLCVERRFVKDILSGMAECELNLEPAAKQKPKPKPKRVRHGHRPKPADAARMECSCLGCKNPVVWVSYMRWTTPSEGIAFYPVCKEHR